MRSLSDKTGPGGFGWRGLWPVTVGLLVALALAVADATASVVCMTDEQRYAASDLIVTGVLAGIGTAEGVRGRRTGLIGVDRVLKGDAGTGMVPLLLPSSNGPRSGEEIDYEPGTSGLWFLRSLGPRAPGLYAADHPQRFVPEGVIQAEVEALGG